MSHPGHSAALEALLLLPVLIITGLMVLHQAAHRGVPGAVRLLRHYTAATPETKLAGLLMAVSATVHLALIPHHAGQPLTTALFALDAGALLGATAWSFLGRGWRPLAAGLLAGGIAAYFFYVGSGREVIDPVGVITKLVEALALGLILVGVKVRGPRPQARPSAEGALS